MNIAIFGTGHVGLVTGACLAEVGNHVVCVDIDAAKVARLKQGDVPIFGPGRAYYGIGRGRSLQTVLHVPAK